MIISIGRIGYIEYNENIIDVFNIIREFSLLGRAKLNGSQAVPANPALTKLSMVWNSESGCLQNMRSLALD